MSHVIGKVRWVLRFEGLAILSLAVYFYSSLGFSWLTFTLFFLLPDLSFIGYLINQKIGAIAYNCAHSMIGACTVLGLSFVLDNEYLQITALIWFAHIGFDRALGYGLKYSKGFKFTHLGKIGK